ncbi:HAD-IIIC family phosphatase [Streptomyces sp. NPDC049687]|uniref:HAD-IIIC family phosphatase n=1 Tax=Streptomyces sp. NPDC049687 TaxID=3365596 RepID=UPI0037A697CD
MTAFDPDRVKCVVWDLDGTLWDDIAVESPTDELPTPRPEMLAAIDALTARGVLSSIASRSAPAVLDRLAGRPEVRERFLAPQVSWQDKSESLRRIAKDLGIAVDALLLVDDSPYERAEVEALLPGVRTLAPEDVPALLAAFEGREVTPESRERVHRYRTEENRRAESERFQGTREEFLRWCAMRLTVGSATPDETPRALELAARTHRLNSSGLTPDRLRELAASDGYELYTARMTDRFGSYGIIGAALVDRTAPGTWSVPLLALSCRVAGRGAAAAFLFWLMGRARRAGAEEFRVTLRPTDANLEMRILLRQAGLRRTDDTGTTADPAVLGRSLHGDLPEPPPYLHVSDREDVQA